MNTVSLSSDDLIELTTLIKDLNFDDVERRVALLENSSRDFNAVPGSGKTSLLAAKLLLLSKKWPHTRKGICVLSHTNVARDEITRRLADTSDGIKLLGYPHFIGTIHSFVNQFFAMPMLRCLGKTVDIIDDDIFAEKALELLQKSQYFKLRYYLDNQRNGDDIVTTLFYRHADLEVHVEKGTLPSNSTDSYHSLMRLKKQLTEKGIFRHRDMFAFAELALQKYPGFLDITHLRFPMVFIDEMQDTSWDQEKFLNRIFDGKSVMQRFGDIDQKIISDDEDSSQLTFPREGYGSISTSKRFGKKIANAVECVRVSGGSVVGENENDYPPTLLLYDTGNVTNVISHYGHVVINTLTDSITTEYKIKAMSTRKSGESEVDAGRHLRDYWPSYDGNRQKDGIRLESFWKLVGEPNGTIKESSLSSRVSDIRKALLLVLRSAKSPLIQDISNARALPRVAKNFAPHGSIEQLTRELALSGEYLCSKGQRDTLIEHLYTELRPYLPNELDFESFKILSIFNNSSELNTPNTSTSTRCEVTHQNITINIGLGTVASMKGETHVASLVLESYGGTSRKFDIALGLEYMVGSASKKIKSLSKTQQAQMRNLYVAMSRPTMLLCLAANEKRVPQPLRDKLISKGWRIEIVT